MIEYLVLTSTISLGAAVSIRTLGQPLYDFYMLNYVLIALPFAI